MSYYDTIERNRFSIQCGDGQLYFPNWKGGTKEIEYNTSLFDFINVSGTLVDRKKPRSPFFDLTFFFQGETYLDDVNKFELSAADPRPWIIVHPIYGYIKGQPLSFKRNDDNLNIVEVTVPFWESIEADYPFSNFNIKDNTRDKKAKVYLYSSESFINNNPIAPDDIPDIADSIVDMSGAMESMQDNSTYADFQNGLNKALKSIDNILDSPFDTIQIIQAFLDLPTTYTQVLEARLGAYEAIYNRLESTIITVANRKYFESIGSSLIASMSVVLITPIPTDYVLMADVFKASQRLDNLYKRYLTKLDDVQVSIYDVNNSFTPDALVQSELSSLVQYTKANLYALSFQAKREKIVYVEKDSNPILLVHRYIGMDNDDVNLAKFVKTNNIKLRELFLVKKGRQIKFAM